ncbi:MAG: alpha-E domain-containing protein [Planctomycetia bacterium]|nr:alpha-E domain-containing protein [Planctomycetia bacterium]
MLSRVADALFWMSRYLERADHLARAVDVTFHLDLDLHGVLSNPVELEWNALLSLLRQQRPPVAEGEHPVAAVQRWLLLDASNPGSVMACVNRSRNNARSIRGSISPPMWRELNKLYWRLADPAIQGRVAESPHDFCQEAQMGVLLFHGVCEATLTHDEGWHFIQLGRHLERADKILRTLDSKFGLLEGGDGADLPIRALQWGAVLRNCAAYEAYQRLYISRVEPERVIEFLLVNADFPHSVRFCLARIMHSLTEISGRLPDRSEDEVVRTVGRLLNDLVYFDGHGLDGDRLHAFLGDALARTARIGHLLHDQYALH